MKKMLLLLILVASVTSCFGMQNIKNIKTKKELAVYVIENFVPERMDKKAWKELSDCINPDNIVLKEFITKVAGQIYYKDDKNRYGTSLNVAALQNDVPEGMLLLWGGADIEATDDYGMTPLHRTASSGFLEFFRLLLEKGANLNTRDYSGQTLLHFAVVRGKKEIFTLLLEKGANLNTRDDIGQTLLHSAVIRGDKAMVAFLLGRNVDTEVKTADRGCRRTPLHCAVYAQHEDIVAQLIDHGVDLGATDDLDMTALEIAKAFGFTGVERCFPSGC